MAFESMNMHKLHDNEISKIVKNAAIDQNEEERNGIDQPNEAYRSNGSIQ